jgi:hypothetical protein
VQATAPAATAQAATPAAVAAAQPASGAPQSTAGQPAAQSAADGVVPPLAQQDAFPAWIGLAMQTAALFAALTTLILAILWWRSRHSEPRT